MIVSKDNSKEISYHFKRQRLIHLFKEAVKSPLTMVCAGAGYGKTSAVHDFAEEYQAATVWIQFSERDNVGVRFWDNFVNSIAKVNKSFIETANKLGFPDTSDKYNQYFSIIKKYFTPQDKRILIMDDVHILDDPLVIRFVERIITNLSPYAAIILISRSTPQLNLINILSKGGVCNISESDLCFTESELALYFQNLSIFPSPESLHEIMQDTEGWAFAINLIARSWQKAPGYGGYLRSALKNNIFRLMETEIWNGISESLQIFLVRLSLIGHLSFDLIELIAGKDMDLIHEMEKENAYIRKDTYINAFIIHPMFLEFLSERQYLLSEEQKQEIYAVAGKWCYMNGFKIDAMSYFEKIGDYNSFILVFFSYGQLPYNIAKHSLVLVERAPRDEFCRVPYLAISHVCCYMRLGYFQKAIKLAEYYEAKFLALPEDSSFRNENLGALYFIWGYIRNFMCIIDNKFDFVSYYIKYLKYYPNPEMTIRDAVRSRYVGAWVTANGSSNKGAPQEYIEAVTAVASILPEKLHGFMAGEDKLAWGELKFYQGDFVAAEVFISQCIAEAGEHRQFEIIHRALLYTLRISIARGNFEKAEQVIDEVKKFLDQKDYPNRYINYDIALAIFYFAMDLPENTSEWIKQNVLPYSHAGFIENFQNQMKLKFYFRTGNYPPVLAYIREMKERESYLYGRAEMLAMEACVHYKMKDRDKAYAALSEAYQTAAPNELIMPFIELGNDMRTLASRAAKEMNAQNCGIPPEWLEKISRKAAAYAKQQLHITAEYKRRNNTGDSIELTPREKEVLADLSHGLSRAEIAASRKLSVNTVKMVIGNIYSKTGVKNAADLICFAVTKKLI